MNQIRFGKAALALAALGVCASGYAAAAPSAQACAARSNDTAARLLECIQQDSLWHHLEAFQQIANRNPDAKGHGNRDTGTPGYEASVDYVARLMRRAGYQVTIQPYNWKDFRLDGEPEFTAADRRFRFSQDWFVARLSGSGDVTAPLQPVGVVRSGGAKTGCARGDFAGFVPGRIALLQRGECDIDRQVANAEAVGASAVVLYNDQGTTGVSDGKAGAKGSALQAQLADIANIPVVGFTSYAVGADLVQRYATGNVPLVHVAISARSKSAVDYNLIADSPLGDPDRVVVVDAHLDSIFGAGMLDNASGSTTILEIALAMAQTPTLNRLRYIWFGGEEIGLLGSHHYTRTLPAKELRKIVFDIDVDVTATPNFAVLVADPAHAHNAGQFPPNVIPGSKVGNRDFAEYFHSVGIPSRNASFGNNGTDSNAFALAGVPDSGILTQQDCCKHGWEVALWGGFTGNYEGKVPGDNGGCVDWPRRWCDNLSNNDPFVLGFVSKAVAAVTLELANDASL